MSEYMRWKKSGKRRMECAEYQYILDDEKKSPKIGSTKCDESKKSIWKISSTTQMMMNNILYMYYFTMSENPTSKSTPTTSAQPRTQ